MLRSFRLLSFLLIGCIAVSTGKLFAVTHLESMRVRQTVAVVDLERVPGLDLGVPGAAAAFLWLRTIAQTGEWLLAKRMREQHYTYLAEQMDAIVRLDPYAQMPSEYAGTLLANWGGKISEAHVILLRSLEGQVTNWRVYFALGSLYYKQYGNLERAAEWWRLAAIQPNVAPKYLANLAQFVMLKNSGKIDELLDEHDKNSLLLPELKNEWQDIYRFREQQKQLNYGLQTFTRRFNRRPKSIQEVVDSGIWHRHPVDPWGGLVKLGPDGATILPSDNIPISPRAEKIVEVDPLLDRGILPKSKHGW